MTVILSYIFIYIWFDDWLNFSFDNVDTFPSKHSCGELAECIGQISSSLSHSLLTVLTTSVRYELALCSRDSSSASMRSSRLILRCALRLVLCMAFSSCSRCWFSVRRSSICSARPFFSDWTACSLVSVFSNSYSSLWRSSSWLLEKDTLMI